MSSGPQHYTSAEFYLNAAQNAEADSHTERYNLAAAQVHATLAQTAAIVTQTHDLAEAGPELNADDWTPVLNNDTA